MTSNKVLKHIAENRGTGQSFQGTDVTARIKNKFEQGFLGGVGSTSQFQGANSMLPVMPAQSNNDTYQRVMSVHGVAGEPILASWQRSYAFAPGRGIDAARSKITWTDSNAGLDPTTGVAAPLINSGIDRQDSGPTPSLTTYQLGNPNTQAPMTRTGGEGATVAERIIQSGKLEKKRRMKK